MNRDDPRTRPCAVAQTPSRAARAVLVPLAVLGALVLAPAARAAAGSGDLADASAVASAIEPDGKIIVAGSVRAGGGSAFALARYDVDGSLDSSFGAGGRVVTAFSGGSALASDVAITPGGQIVVAGTVVEDRLDPRGFQPRRFALARYNPDGSLDRSFSRNGKLTTGFRDSAGANAVAVAPDGRIVAAGVATIYGGGTDFALARYRPDGSLDRSFAGDGRRTTDFSARERRHRNDSAGALALQADGRIVAAGQTDSGGDRADFALARYRPDGALDRSFAGDGRLTRDICGYAGVRVSGVALQRDGKLVAAGATDCGFTLARFDGDGTFDSSFGGDGTVVNEFGVAMALQGDGRIVAAGGAGSDFALARYDADGSLDGSVGSAGVVTTAFAESAAARDVALARDGRIVAAGVAGSGTLTSFALARYDADGSLDRSLAGDGTVMTTFSRRDLENADHVVAVGIEGTHVRLRERSLKVVLVCPQSELSPPCAGTLTLRARRVVLARHSFSIAAGRKRRVMLRLSGSEARLVRRHRTARRMSAIVRVYDAAGNEARFVKRMTLVSTVSPARVRRASFARRWRGLGS